MGWSIPQVPEPEQVTRWSPWICLFIIGSGCFIALLWIVLNAPPGGLPPLSSGIYLPITGTAMGGVLVSLLLYFFWLEVHSLWYFNQVTWQRNIDLAWQRWAHQHLYVVKNTLFTADADLIPRIAGLLLSNPQDEPCDPLLFPEEVMAPGLRRFEGMTRHLLQSLSDNIHRLPPGVKVKLVIQTQVKLTDEYKQSVATCWGKHYPKYTSEVNLVDDTSFSAVWDDTVKSHGPVILLAMHYYDGNTDTPVAEAASALLVLPPALLTCADREVITRLFRPMPVRTGILSDELAELRDMSQQPADTVHLVWHSGLSDVGRQKLNAVACELELSLRHSAPAGGVVDFDKDNEKYGVLSGWLMAAAAVQMVEYGQGTQWVFCSEGKQAWAMVAGNSFPAVSKKSAKLPQPPYPAGTLMLGAMFNLIGFSVIAQACPSWLFSWAGSLVLLLSLVVTLPGCVLLLRGTVEYFQRPRFIEAARQNRTERNNPA